MDIHKNIAAILSLAVFVIIYGLLCWPTVCAIRLIGWTFRQPEPTIRSRIARCAHWWGSVVFSVVCKLLRLDVWLTVDGERDLLRDGTCIIIANHQSTLDVAVMAWLVCELGRTNARWIMKEPLRNAPVVGWIAQRIGCAFVARQKNPADVVEITRCIDILREDRASVVLFPEGTRFERARATKEFSHVLPPKKTGFTLLRNALRDAPVVTVTLQWIPPVADGSRGKTIFQAADFYGKLLRIQVRIVPADHVRADPNWLEHDWESKNRLLASFHTESA